MDIPGQRWHKERRTDRTRQRQKRCRKVNVYIEREIARERDTYLKMLFSVHFFDVAFLLTNAKKIFDEGG